VHFLLCFLCYNSCEICSNFMLVVICIYCLERNIGYTLNLRNPPKTLKKSILKYHSSEQEGPAVKRNLPPKCLAKVITQKNIYIAIAVRIMCDNSRWDITYSNGKITFRMLNFYVEGMYVGRDFAQKPVNLTKPVNQYRCLTCQPILFPPFLYTCPCLLC